MVLLNLVRIKDIKEYLILKILSFLGVPKTILTRYGNNR